jgi:hypothetical protein
LHGTSKEKHSAGQGGLSVWAVGSFLATTVAETRLNFEHLISMGQRRAPEIVLRRFGWPEPAPAGYNGFTLI